MIRNFLGYGGRTYLAHGRLADPGQVAEVGVGEVGNLHAAFLFTASADSVTTIDSTYAVTDIVAVNRHQ